MKNHHPNVQLVHHGVSNPDPDWMKTGGPGSEEDQVDPGPAWVWIRISLTLISLESEPGQTWVHVYHGVDEIRGHMWCVLEADWLSRYFS